MSTTLFNTFYLLGCCIPDEDVPQRKRHFVYGTRTRLWPPSRVESTDPNDGLWKFSPRARSPITTSCSQRPSLTYSGEAVTVLGHAFLYPSAMAILLLATSERNTYLQQCMSQGGLQLPEILLPQLLKC
jgi:hypothetical protein